jgi:hypothetical protein
MGGGDFRMSNELIKEEEKAKRIVKKRVTPPQQQIESKKVEEACLEIPIPLPPFYNISLLTLSIPSIIIKGN